MRIKSIEWMYIFEMRKREQKEREREREKALPPKVTDGAIPAPQIVLFAFIPITPAQRVPCEYGRKPHQ